MDNKTIATKLPEGIDQRVSATHGWCQITDLSGELHEGLFMATFADDSRIVFEDDEHGFLHVLLTKEQTENWDACTIEEQIEMLEEILLFYRRHMKDNGLRVKESSDDNCPLGGDTKNDCAGCVYSSDFHYEEKTGMCIKRVKGVGDEV